jgi:hypothetical protein
MGVSIRAFARVIDRTEGAVRKAIKSKRISTLADGTIDPEVAKQEWTRNTFAGQTLHAIPPKAPVHAAPTQQAPEVTNDPNQAYLRARAVKATFEAKTAQLEYEERAGKLIQATKAGEYAASFSSIVGDALSALPDRLTPLLAASTDEDVVHKILSNEIAALRRKVAKAITDAGF